MAKLCGRFLAIYPDPVNMRKVSRDLADCGRYTEAFCLSALLGTICGNYLSKKIVRQSFVENFIGQLSVDTQQTTLYIFL